MQGPKFLYLDHGSTSFPKPKEVVDAYVHYATGIGVSPGRGAYEPAIDAGRAIFNTRKAIAKLINAPLADRIILTKNATEALNIAIFGYLKPGDKVVSTKMEHNAVIRPLLHLQRKGIIDVFWADLNDDATLNMGHFYELANQPGVKMVAVTGISNVTGVVNPLGEIGEFCRKRGITFLVDGAQLLGAYPVDVQAENIDMLAFTGHKCLLGPPGTGGLYVREGICLEPLLYGGTGGQSELETMPDAVPERYEAGTPNTPGIYALGVAVEYIMNYGVEKIRNHKKEILQIVLDGLSDVPGIRLLGPNDTNNRTAIVPMVLDGISAEQVGQILWKKFRIAIRAGMHCAPMIHRHFGVSGTARYSFGLTNTKEDAVYAVECARKVMEMK